jgi:hypothetical protein
MTADRSLRLAAPFLDSLTPVSRSLRQARRQDIGINRGEYERRGSSVEQLHELSGIR